MLESVFRRPVYANGVEEERRSGCEDTRGDGEISQGEVERREVAMREVARRGD